MLQCVLVLTFSALLSAILVGLNNYEKSRSFILFNFIHSIQKSIKKYTRIFMLLKNWLSQLCSKGAGCLTQPFNSPPHSSICFSFPHNPLSPYILQKFLPTPLNWLFFLQEQWIDRWLQGSLKNHPKRFSALWKLCFFHYASCSFRV